MNLVTPNAAAKLELLFEKPASEADTWGTPKSQT